MSKCKCGKEIVFAEITKADGTPGRIPLDKSAPCYAINTSFDGKYVGAIRRTDVFVSHFATCKHANDFSGGKARPQ